MEKYFETIQNLEDAIHESQQVLVDLNDQVRKLKGESTLSHKTWGEASISEKNSPWIKLKVSQTLPNMLSREDSQYISWISRIIPEHSTCLEFGPWLGQSTQLLMSGLDKNSRLHVVDDFIWRSEWMSPYVTEELDHQNKSSFKDTFIRLNSNIINKIELHEAGIELTSENKHLPRFDMIFEKGLDFVLVDCGRTFSVNEAWWNRIRPFLRMNQTLIVLQDFRTHREVPRKWWNQMDLWVESKGNELEQIHEVRDGGIASFVFKGLK
jgi:hypothetical protein